MPDVLLLLLVALAGLVLSFLVVSIFNTGGTSDQSLNRDLNQIIIQFCVQMSNTIFLPIKGVWSILATLAITAANRAKWAAFFFIFTGLAFLMHYYHHEILSVVDDGWTCAITPLMKNVVRPLLNLNRVLFAIGTPIANALLVINGQLISAALYTSTRCSHIGVFRIFTELASAIIASTDSLSKWFGAGDDDPDSNFFTNDFDISKPVNHTMAAIIVAEKALECACARFEPIFAIGFAVFEEPHVVHAVNNAFQGFIRGGQMIFGLLIKEYPDAHRVSFKVERAVVEAGLALDSIAFKSLKNIIKLFSPGFEMTRFPVEGPFSAGAQAIASGVEFISVLGVNGPLYMLESTFHPDKSPFNTEVWSMDEALSYSHRSIYSGAVFAQWAVYVLEKLVTDTFSIGEVFTDPDTPLDLTCDWARDVKEHKYVSLGYTIGCSIYNAGLIYTNAYAIAYGAAVELLTKSIFTQEQNAFRTLQRWEGPFINRKKVYSCEERTEMTAYDYKTNTYYKEGSLWTGDRSRCSCTRPIGTTFEEGEAFYNPWCGQPNLNFDVFAPMDALVMHVSHGILGPGLGDTLPYMKPMDGLDIKVPLGDRTFEKFIPFPFPIPPLTRTAVESLRIMVRIFLSFGDIVTGHFFNYPVNCGHGLNMIQLEARFNSLYNNETALIYDSVGSGASSMWDSFSGGNEGEEAINNLDYERAIEAGEKNRTKILDKIQKEAYNEHCGGPIFEGNPIACGDVSAATKYSKEIRNNAESQAAGQEAYDYAYAELDPDAKLNDYWEEKLAANNGTYVPSNDKGDEELRWTICKAREYSAMQVTGELYVFNEETGKIETGRKRMPTCDKDNDNPACMCSYMAPLTANSKCKCISRFPLLEVAGASQQQAALIEKRFTSEEVSPHWCNSMIIEWMFQNTGEFINALDYIVSLGPINPTCDVLDRLADGDGVGFGEQDRRLQASFIIETTPTMRFLDQFMDAETKINNVRSVYASVEDPGCQLVPGNWVNVTDEYGNIVWEFDPNCEKTDQIKEYERLYTNSDGEYEVNWYSLGCEKPKPKQIVAQTEWSCDDSDQYADIKFELWETDHVEPLPGTEIQDRSWGNIAGEISKAVARNEGQKAKDNYLNPIYNAAKEFYENYVKDGDIPYATTASEARAEAAAKAATAIASLPPWRLPSEIQWVGPWNLQLKINNELIQNATVAGGRIVDPVKVLYDTCVKDTIEAMEAMGLEVDENMSGDQLEEGAPCWVEFKELEAAEVQRDEMIAEATGAGVDNDDWDAEIKDKAIEYAEKIKTNSSNTAKALELYNEAYEKHMATIPESFTEEYEAVDYDLGKRGGQFGSKKTENTVGCRISGRNDLFCSLGLAVRAFKRMSLHTMRQIAQGVIATLSGNFEDVIVNELIRVCDMEKYFGALSSAIGNAIPKLPRAAKHGITKVFNANFQYIYIFELRLWKILWFSLIELGRHAIAGTLDGDAVKSVVRTFIDTVADSLVSVVRMLIKAVGDLFIALLGSTAGKVFQVIIGILDIVQTELKNELMDIVLLILDVGFNFIAMFSINPQAIANFFSSFFELWIKTNTILIRNVWKILGQILKFFGVFGDFMAVLVNGVCIMLNAVMGVLDGTVRTVSFGMASLGWESMECVDLLSVARNHTSGRLGKHFLRAEHDEDLPRRIAEILDWNGSSVCDHLMTSAADYKFTELRPLERAQWTECMELKFLGIQLGGFLDLKSFPEDLFYNWKRKYAMAYDLFRALKIVAEEYYETQTINWGNLRHKFYENGLDPELYMRGAKFAAKFIRTGLSSLKFLPIAETVLEHYDPNFKNVSNPSMSARTWRTIERGGKIYDTATKKWSEEDGTQLAWHTMDKLYDSRHHVKHWWNSLGKDVPADQPKHMDHTQKLLTNFKRNIGNLYSENTLKTRKHNRKPKLRLPILTSVASCYQRGSPTWCSDCAIVDNLIENTVEQAQAMSNFYVNKFPPILVNVSLYFNEMLDYNKDFFEGTAARLASTVQESNITIYDQNGNPIPTDGNGNPLVSRWNITGEEWKTLFTDLGLYIQNTSNETRKHNWKQNIDKFFNASHKFVTTGTDEYVPFYNYGFFHIYNWMFFSKCDMEKSIYVTRGPSLGERLKNMDRTLIYLLIVALAILTNQTWSVIPLFWMTNMFVISSIVTFGYLYGVYGYHINCVPLIPYTFMEDIYAWYDTRLDQGCFYKNLPFIAVNASEDTCLTCAAPQQYMNCANYTNAGYQDGMLPLSDLISEYSILWPSLFLVRWKMPKLMTFLYRRAFFDINSVIGKLVAQEPQGQSIDPVWIDCYHAMWLDNVLVILGGLLIIYITGRLTIVAVQTIVQAVILVTYTYTAINYMSLAVEQSVVVTS